MNLLNDFFKILAVGQADSKYTVGIELNAAHEIFNGHFPGNPVVPGVCMVQVIKEILAHLFKREFTIKQASQLKFLAILNPAEVKSLNVEISVLRNEAEGMIVSGTFQKGELIFMKYKATFVPHSGQ
jgi:3-hydroxyacyl-[acyl-carrier-protein] dehydratase